MVVHETESEGVWAIFCRHKGSSEYVKKRVCDIIKRLGYSKIILMSDQEHAVNELEERIKEHEFKEFDKWGAISRNIAVARW